MPRPGYRWVVLAVATLAQACTCFLVQGLGAIAGFLQAGLGLDAFRIGLLVSAALLVPVIGLVVAGELLDRFGERLIVGTGAMMVALGLIGASTAPSYAVLLIWLILVGIGYSTAQPGGSKSVAIWFPGHQRGLAMGIRQAGLPLGGAMAALALPLIAAAYGWQAAFLAGGLVALFGGLQFILLYRAPAVPSFDRVARADARRFTLADRMAILWLPGMKPLILGGLALIAVQYALQVFLPLDLRGRFGLPLETGTHLLFVAQCAGIVGRIGLAAWGDRSRGGRGRPIRASIAGVAIGIVLLLAAPALPLWAVAILAAWLGFFGFGWYGPWVAAVVEAAPPERAGLALGLAMAVNQIAIIACPPALGAARDATGSFDVPWLVLLASLVVVLVTGRGR